MKNANDTHEEEESGTNFLAAHTENVSEKTNRTKKKTYLISDNGNNLLYMVVFC